MTEASGDGEHYSRLIGDLCALLVTVISPPSPRRRRQQQQQHPRRLTRPPSTGMSPAAVASMLLGMSMALMLCGSVTFAVGLLLMPWVAGLALLFSFAGAVSTLSSGFFGKSAGLPCKGGGPISPAPDKVVVVA